MRRKPNALLKLPSKSWTATNALDNESLALVNISKRKNACTIGSDDLLNLFDGKRTGSKEASILHSSFPVL